MAYLLLVTLCTFTIEVIQDGIRYTCEPAGPPNPGAAVECATVAYRGPFSTEQSNRICQGARSNAPAECGIAAYRGPFSIEQSISLCQGASSNAPIDCALEAYRGPFSYDQALRLCSNNGSTLNSDCAIRAYAGPYSLDEAINLCMNANAKTVSSVLDHVPGSSAKDGMAAVVKRANQKAFERGELSFEKARSLKF